MLDTEKEWSGCTSLDGGHKDIREKVTICLDILSSNCLYLDGFSQMSIFSILMTSIISLIGVDSANHRGQHPIPWA